MIHRQPSGKVRSAFIHVSRTLLFRYPSVVVKNGSKEKIVIITSILTTPSPTSDASLNFSRRAGDSVDMFDRGERRPAAILIFRMGARVLYAISPSVSQPRNEIDLKKRYDPVQVSKVWHQRTSIQH
jgi:hypothetical protein